MSEIPTKNDAAASKSLKRTVSGSCVPGSKAARSGTRSLDLWKNGGDEGSPASKHRREFITLGLREVGSYRLGPRPVGWSSSFFVTAAVEDPHASLPGVCRKLLRQAALTDSRLPDEHIHLPMFAHHTVGSLPQVNEFFVSSDEGIWGRLFRVGLFGDIDFARAGWRLDLQSPLGGSAQCKCVGIIRIDGQNLGRQLLNGIPSLLIHRKIDLLEEMLHKMLVIHCRNEDTSLQAASTIILGELAYIGTAVFRHALEIFVAVDLPHLLVQLFYPLGLTLRAHKRRLRCMDDDEILAPNCRDKVIGVIRYREVT